MDFNPHTDYHTYAIEWTPEYVAWFIDGAEAYRQTGPHIEILSNPQKIMMNVWNPVWENWVGRLDAANLPGFAFYDWVAYYSYNPGGGNYGTGNNFEYEWRDDFDSFDSDRWEKATHTWGGNNSDFVQENAVLVDGKLILCLTDNDVSGFVDLNPPGIETVHALTDGRVRVKMSEFVTKESAEVVGNYLISGVDIISAELLADNKTVELSCNNIELTSSYYLIIIGITDLYGNVTPSKAKKINMPGYDQLPLKINIGGGSWSDFIGEQEKEADNFHGFLDGAAMSFPGIEITNTEQDEIYRTSRQDIVKYLVNVPAGTYKLTLMMSENSYQNAGERVFDILINGKMVTENLDLYKEAGKNSALELVINEINIVDELLEISFNAEIGNPTISGLVVEQTSTTDMNNFGELTPQYFLEQNYPNPFNGSTTINYSLSESDQVQLLIYDSLGQKVFSSPEAIKSAGDHSINWDAKSNRGELINSGIYFYQIIGKNPSTVRKLVYLK